MAGRHRASLPYHDGKIVKCHANPWWRRTWKWTIGSSVANGLGTSMQATLLWVFVEVKTDCAYYKDVLRQPQRAGELGSMPEALMVSGVRTAVCSHGGWRGTAQAWLIASFFLGRQGSFAVDAARFGIGLCAYFLDRRPLYRGIWSKSPHERCRVYKYSFREDKSELVEQLPAQWKDMACMWLTPQPAMTSTEEIRGKLEASRVSTAEQRDWSYFRIYVGNLIRKVDDYQLRQLFGKHGKVADVRIMYNRKTRRSRGFGFVTMGPAKDDEPADIIAKLHGQSLDGRPLQVCSLATSNLKPVKKKNQPATCPVPSTIP